MKCPHCQAELPEGAKICRGCGRLVEGGAESSSAPPSRRPPSSRPARGGSAPDTVAGAPHCEICETSPVMVQQVERSSPTIPAVLGLVAFSLFVLTTGFDSLGVRVLLILTGLGLCFAAYRIMTDERRYWLCPKCGDTTDI